MSLLRAIVGNQKGLVSLPLQHRHAIHDPVPCCEPDDQKTSHFIRLCIASVSLRNFAGAGRRLSCFRGPEALLAPSSAEARNPSSTLPDTRATSPMRLPDQAASLPRISDAIDGRRYIRHGSCVVTHENLESLLLVGA